MNKSSQIRVFQERLEVVSQSQLKDPATDEPIKFFKLYTMKQFALEVIHAIHIFML